MNNESDLFAQIKTAEKYNSTMFNSITEEQLIDELNGSSNVTPPNNTSDPNPHPNQPDNTANNYAGGIDPDNPNKNQPNYGFIEPSIAIGLIDSIVPAVIVFAYGMFMNKKIKPSLFILTAAEKKTLEPIIQACLKTIVIDLNKPWAALMVVGGAIYGGKVLMIDNNEWPDKATPAIKKDGENKVSTGVKRGRPFKK